MVFHIFFHKQVLLIQTSLFQLQGTCNHEKKFMDIFIGYPGSVHDARVFRVSTLRQNLREKCGEFYLFGDSAYPCSQNLITPYKDRGNLTRIQRNFNLQHSSWRISIEHTFGLLKQKFRQLLSSKIKKYRRYLSFYSSMLCSS